MTDWINRHHTHVHRWPDYQNMAQINRVDTQCQILQGETNGAPTRQEGVRGSSVVRAFAHDAMGHRIDPSWGGPIDLFLVPASGDNFNGNLYIVLSCLIKLVFFFNFV